jgi:Zinc-finger of C2H2 type
MNANHRFCCCDSQVYKCTLCHMTFSSKKAMEAHIKTHSGSVPSNNSESSALQLHTSATASSSLNISSPYEQPAAPRAERVSIDPALLTAIDLREGGRRRSGDDDDSRSSSGTPPLRVDEDATPIEPAVRLCPNPLSMLPSGGPVDYLPASAPAQPSYLLLERRKRCPAPLPTPPRSNPDSPSPSSSPDPACGDDPAVAPRKRSKMILQRYLQESTPPLRSSSVIRFAQRGGAD